MTQPNTTQHTENIRRKDQPPSLPLSPISSGPTLAEQTAGALATSGTATLKQNNNKKMEKRNRQSNSPHLPEDGDHPVLTPAFNVSHRPFVPE